MTQLNQKTMHAAVEQRDAHFDHRFVFGVVTTGVFCLPSCHSRTARPENRRFFETPAQAMIAGFRPCKKCSPIGRSPILEKLIDTARFIEENASQKLSLNLLAKRVDLSAAQLRRGFQATLGLTPTAMIDGVRLRSYRAALNRGETVTHAAYAAGYSSISQVYGNKGRDLGMEPNVYSRGAAGEEIAYLVRKTQLGYLLLAATERGVCFADFADSENELLVRFADEFPAAQRVVVSEEHLPMLKDWMTAFVDHIAGCAPKPDVPLDLRGSTFQMQVWRYLMQLQAGDLVSYTDVAKAIGKPKSVRAAASACGANRVAVLVPCHRVLRADGGLGGYRWGLPRKKALLTRERKN